MPKKRSNPNENDYPYPHLKPKWVLYTRIIVCTIGGLGIIWGLCSYITDKAVFWQVLMGSAVTWLILMQMLFQTHVSQKQWKAMRKGLKQTRELFELSERPALGVKFQWDWLSDDTSRITLTVKNSGKSPAKKVIVTHKAIPYGVGTFGDYPEPPSERTSIEETGSPVIPVGGEILRFTDVRGAKAAVFLGISVVFVWVYITYESLSGREYFFEAYVRYEPKRNKFKYCPIHNDAN